MFELCRDGQRLSHQATRARHWECLGGGRRHAVKHAVFVHMCECHMY